MQWSRISDRVNLSKAYKIGDSEKNKYLEIEKNYIGTYIDILNWQLHSLNYDNMYLSYEWNRTTWVHAFGKEILMAPEKKIKHACNKKQILHQISKAQIIGGIVNAIWGPIEFKWSRVYNKRASRK